MRPVFLTLKIIEETLGCKRAILCKSVDGESAQPL